MDFEAIYNGKQNHLWNNYQKKINNIFTTDFTKGENLDLFRSQNTGKTEGKKILLIYLSRYIICKNLFFNIADTKFFTTIKLLTNILKPPTKKVTVINSFESIITHIITINNFLHCSIIELKIKCNNN